MNDSYGGARASHGEVQLALVAMTSARLITAIELPSFKVI
jgi:hypothetical protein